MICKKCGAEVSSNSKFCVSCGAKCDDAGSFPEHPKMEIETASKSQIEKVDKKIDFGDSLIKDESFGEQDIFQDETKETKKKKKKKWLVPLLIGAVILLILGIFALLSFPLRMTISSQNEVITTNGQFDNFQIKVKSNQPISGVYYSVDPKDFENLDAYTKINSGGIYSREAVIDNLKIPAGESKLYICVTTIFGGKKIHEVPVEFDMGYISAPEEDMIVEYAEGKEMVSNEVLLVAKAGTEPDEVEKLADEYGGVIVGAIYPINQYQIRFDNSGIAFIDSKINELKNESIVEEAIYNSVYGSSSLVFPGDSGYDSWESNSNNPDGNNWGLECIDAPIAWDYNDQMSIVKVGVIDSYLDYDHEDLQIDKKRFMFMPSSDFTDPDEFWDYYENIYPNHLCYQQDCNICSAFDGHGSHVAGIIGAINDDKGVCGVNWKADVVFASLWHLAKSDAERNYIFYDTTASFNMSLTHCILSDCRVINMSFGSYAPVVTANEDAENEVFDNMILNFENQGYDFLICKSAGNEGIDASNCRTVRKLTAGENARRHTIIVGSIGNYTRRYTNVNETFFEKSQFSNYGDTVDIMAPGEEILSTISDNQYDSWQGTSMASPMVAGAASTIYSLNPNITYEYVKTLICNTPSSWCYYNDKVYPVLNVGNAVKYAVDNDWVNVDLRTDPDRPQLGYIHGAIQDAETGSMLPYASLVCKAEDGTEYRAGTYEGLYQCQLPAGVYDMTFACSGYISETVYDVEVSNDVITYNVLLNMVKDGDEKGVASGYIIDAFDASGVSNASISIYRGLNCTTGTPVISMTADAYGYYSVELEPGNYTVVGTATGYQMGYGNIIVIADQTRSNQDCSLTPILNDGEIRIVLTWGASPRDLDSHMVGPSPDGRFHTYFSNKNHQYQGEVYCNLDVDDTTSYGPETTSVYKGTDGVYTFYVHDYTNRGSTFSKSLAMSGATVKVYVAGQSAPKVFNVPNVAGTLWKVCSIKDNVITPINDVTYMANHALIGDGISVR